MDKAQHSHPAGSSEATLPFSVDPKNIAWSTNPKLPSCEEPRTGGGAAVRASFHRGHPAPLAAVVSGKTQQRLALQSRRGLPSVGGDSQQGPAGAPHLCVHRAADPGWPGGREGRFRPGPQQLSGAHQAPASMHISRSFPEVHLWKCFAVSSRVNSQGRASKQQGAQKCTLFLKFRTQLQSWEVQKLCSVSTQ